MENVMTATETDAHILATGQIVAQLAKQYSESQVTSLIISVRKALMTDISEPTQVEVKYEAKVTKGRSLTEHSVTCMCCGTTMLSLKRHLRVSHNLTPEAYRAMWNLPTDWPIVAPDYSKRRSQLAKDNGLGKK